MPAYSFTSCCISSSVDCRSGISASQELRYARKAQKDRWKVAHGIPPSPLREEEGEEEEEEEEEAGKIEEKEEKEKAAMKEEAETVKEGKNVKQPRMQEIETKTSSGGGGFYSQLLGIKEAVVEKATKDSPPPPPKQRDQRKQYQCNNNDDDDDHHHHHRNNNDTSPGPPPPPSPKEVVQVQAKEYGQVNPPAAPTSTTMAPALPPRTPQQQQPQQQQQQQPHYPQQQPLFNTRADALAWELREARLEEELDKAHCELERVHSMLSRKEAELQRVKEGAGKSMCCCRRWCEVLLGFIHTDTPFFLWVYILDVLVFAVVVVRLLCSPPSATCGGSTVGVARNERKPRSSKFEIEEIERN